MPAALGTETEVALEGVRRLEAFYRSLGMPTRLSEAGITNVDYAALARRALPTEDSAVGEYIRLHPSDIVEIYKLAE